MSSTHLHQTHASEAHLGSVRHSRATIGVDRRGEVPCHIDVWPADAAIVHRDHVAGDVGVHALHRVTDLLAGLVDKLIVGAGERTAAAHSDEVAAWLGDLFPGHESVLVVEDSGVGIASVWTDCRRDPVDLAVTVCCADFAGGLGSHLRLLVAQHGDGNSAAVCAVQRVSIAGSHPVVLSKVDRATGHPGEDVVCRVDEASKPRVRARHATHCRLSVLRLSTL